MPAAITYKHISNGDVFERVAPCGSANYPQPGDRYAVSNRWNIHTALLAIGRTIGPWYSTETLSALDDEAQWKRVNVDELASLLDVLVDELAALKANLS